jgi:hypothetical protein
VRKQIHYPRGNFCTATLIYFQITLPGSCTVTPRYQWRRPSVPVEAAILANGGDHMYQWRRPKTYSFAGLDGIGLLQQLREDVAPALTIIYSQSLSSGVVSEDWRNSNVTPLFKKGKKTDPFNAAVLDKESVRACPLCFIFALVFYLNSTQSRQSATLFSSELGLPHPFRRRRVCPPTLWSGGEGTLACG